MQRWAGRHCHSDHTRTHQHAHTHTHKHTLSALAGNVCRSVTPSHRRPTGASHQCQQEDVLCFLVPYSKRHEVVHGPLVARHQGLLGNLLLNEGRNQLCFPEFALYCAIETQYTHHTKIVYLAEHNTRSDRSSLIRVFELKSYVRKRHFRATELETQMLLIRVCSVASVLCLSPILPARRSRVRVSRGPFGPGPASLPAHPSLDPSMPPACRLISQERRFRRIALRSSNPSRRSGSSR